MRPPHARGVDASAKASDYVGIPEDPRNCDEENIPLDLVDKLVIAQKFDISAWVRPTLAAFGISRGDDQLVGSQPVGLGASKIERRDSVIRAH